MYSLLYHGPQNKEFRNLTCLWWYSCYIAGPVGCLCLNKKRTGFSQLLWHSYPFYTFVNWCLICTNPYSYLICTFLHGLIMPNWWLSLGMGLGCFFSFFKNCLEKIVSIYYNASLMLHFKQLHWFIFFLFFSSNSCLCCKWKAHLFSAKNDKLFSLFIFCFVYF